MLLASRTDGACVTSHGSTMEHDPTRNRGRHSLNSMMRRWPTPVRQGRGGPDIDEQGQPYGGLVGICPGDAVATAGWQEYGIARAQVMVVRLAGDRQPGATGEHHDPFRLGLVVPEPVR